MLRIVCTRSPSTRSRLHGDLKCTCWQFSLSGLKCCLELLILSGELECKSGKSSFILMSQVLDLLKRVYWNGLELTTFKEPCIFSCLWCRYGYGKLVFPTQAHCKSSISILCCSYSEALSFSSNTSESYTLPDRSFMLIQAVWRRLWQRNDKRPGFI